MVSSGDANEGVLDSQGYTGSRWLESNHSLAMGTGGQAHACQDARGRRRYAAADLEALPLAAAVDRGVEIGRVYTEVASGLNENRQELARLFRDATSDPPQVLLIEFKDRLARFGFQYLVDHLAHLGVRVEILESESKEPQQELVEDMIAIVTSFSARIYG